MKAFLDPLTRRPAPDHHHRSAGRPASSIENGRATGVAYTPARRDRTGRAEREVLVGAGTYNSAKLLMLSGIGPADHLRDHGIAVVADLPGVGQNLQDHHEVPVIATTKGTTGYFGQDRGWHMLRNGLQYLLFNSGPGHHDRHRGLPVLSIPMAASARRSSSIASPIVYLDRDVSASKPTYGVTFTSCLLRPKARGSVTLRSADPADQPLVDCNFFGDPDDLRADHRRAALRPRDCSRRRRSATRSRASSSPAPAMRRRGDLAAHCRADGEDQLPSGRHARMGPGRRPDGGGRRATAACAASRACG